jgi:membrane associated rhomboid family serine protease
MLILSDDVENTDPPIVNILLIAINVLVFIWMVGSGSGTSEEFFKTWGTVPGRFAAHPSIDQFQFVLTSMFMHGGFLHLIGNMWALWLFGDNVEDRMGHFTYLVFYLICGLFADMVHIFSDPYSMTPCVGASGAIAGVMGAYMVLHPQATCKTWWGDDSLFFAFRTYRVPAILIIGGWFALQVLACNLTGLASNVAFYAHIGGFLAGVGLLCFIRYRDYQASHREEPVRYGGALPAICITALMVLVWHFVSPFMKNANHVQSAAHTKPAAATKPDTPAKAHGHEPLARPTTTTSHVRHHTPTSKTTKTNTGVHNKFANQETTNKTTKSHAKPVAATSAAKKPTTSEQIMREAQSHNQH